jgi:hypothetical protein
MDLILFNQEQGAVCRVNFLTGALDGRLTFSRASTASYFDATGALTQAASGTPRFDYDPTTHVLKGLLLEEARTNLFLNNTAPVSQSMTVVAKSYTLSFYGDGSITYSGAASGTVTGTGAFPTRTSSTFTATAGTLVLTVSGNVSYPQLELGGFATSVILTGSSSVTRAMDSLSMSGIPWFNPVGGALAINFLPLVSYPNNQIWYIAGFSDGTGSNMIFLYDNTYGGNNALGGIITSGGTVQKALAQASSLVTDSSNRIGMNYSTKAMAVSVNGGTPLTYTGAMTLPTPTQLSFAPLNGAGMASGWYRSFAYWNDVLDTASLKSA